MLKKSVFTHQIKKITSLIFLMLLMIDLHAQVFPDSYDSIPLDYIGKKFKLSQQYPTTLPTVEVLPWAKIDFRKKPLDYLQAVYQYVLEGNIEADWKPQDNAIRKWYHVPWMHWNAHSEDIVSGRREFISGLTRERDSRPHELHVQQYNSAQNWAIGMFNPTGGYIIGKVWKDAQNPDPSVARFPYGTVSTKLLYTVSDSTEVPYLIGAPEKQAYVYTHTSENKMRVIKNIRLLQVDIAVRDARADDASGWVFGTLVYDGTIDNPDPWMRMLPVGISWGNDAGVSPQNVSEKGLHETFINPKTQKMLKLGWAGRLNGPVDNPNSSCISCHSTASYPMLMEQNPGDNMSESERMHWFNKNVRSGESYHNNVASLDFSLQLATGIQNFYAWENLHTKKTKWQHVKSRIITLTADGIYIPFLIGCIALLFIGNRYPDVFLYKNQSNISIALLVLRIGIGVFFIIHGYPKVAGGPVNWLKLGQSMSNYGIYSYPMFWGFMSGIAEFGGGLLILLGFWFKPACLLLVINMSVASIKHIAAGDDFGSSSHAMESWFIFLFLLIAGPGKYGLDNLFYKPSLKKNING